MAPRKVGGSASAHYPTPLRRRSHFFDSFDSPPERPMSFASVSSSSLSLLVFLLPAMLSGCSGDEPSSALPDGGGNAAQVAAGGTAGGVGGTATWGSGGAGSSTIVGSVGGNPAAGGDGSTGGTFVGTSGGGPGAGGGSGGTAPTSICMVGDPNSMSGELIDDMEVPSGWYASNDGATAQMPSNGSFALGAGLEGPGANGSSYAMHTTANVPDGAEWGATVQLSLGTNTAAQWDGVKFWAKGSGDMRLNLVTKGTLPSDEGGTCNGTCYDSHGARVSLRGEWTEVKVFFSEVRQEGFGTAVDFNAGELLAVAIQTKNPGNYDIWVDDLHFFTEQGTADCVNYPGDSRCEATQEYCAECGADPRCECVLAECIETGVLEGPLACNQQVMSQRQGGSTRYWISQASSDRDTSGGYEALGCGFPVISKGSDQGSAASQDKVAGAPGGGTLFGALNSADFGADARLCGACVLINDHVTIQIVDECPNRAGAQGNSACTSGHIDLSVAAANQVGGDNPGISWKVVPCENATPEYFWHWDTTSFWGALSIAGLRYPAAKVELQDGANWLEGKRKPYWGAWIFGKDEEIPGSSGSVPPPPWIVRITDIHGQVLQDKFDSPSGDYANPVQNGTAVPYPSLGMIQLPVCGM